MRTSVRKPGRSRYFLWHRAHPWHCFGEAWGAAGKLGNVVNVVAVQAELSMKPYLSAAAFRAWILELTEEALTGLPDAPTLVAFPEAIGFPLLLTLDNPGAPRSGRVLPGALRLAARRWRALLGTARRYRSLSPSLLFLERALPAFRVYHDSFAEAARTFGVTLVAGSSFLPHVEREASRGLHIADPRVRNTAFTFGPTGTLLGRSHKCYFTPGLEASIGLSRGALRDLTPFETPLGRVGVAICLDAFYSSVVERFDGLGTRILVQPSANFAPWRRRWPVDERLSEGEAWLEHGLRAQLQDRLYVQVGVNPMLVGELWDLAAQGRSSLVVNRRYHPDARLLGYGGLLALADAPDRSAWVRATLELDPSGRAPR